MPVVPGPSENPERTVGRLAFKPPFEKWSQWAFRGLSDFVSNEVQNRFGGLRAGRPTMVL